MDDLEKIAQQIVSCRRCPLYKEATQAVPGEGSPKAKVLLLGEGPGFWEDRKGRPFVGPAGKLLDELLTLIKLAREDIFITNLVKHRPPNNRDPQPSEIEACSFWVDKQIEIINPKIIVTLGRFSLNKFLPGESISKVHGQKKIVNFAGRKHLVIPLYHPAAALRSAKIKKEIKEDFETLRTLK